MHFEPFLSYGLKLSAGEHVFSESDMHKISRESLETKDSGGTSQPPYFLPSKSGLSKSQKKVVEERVRAIHSEVPIYVAIMRKSSFAVPSRSMLVSLILFYLSSILIFHSSGFVLFILTWFLRWT